MKQSDHNQFVQYGCGWSAPKTWTNFDASPTLRFERLPLIGRLYTKNAARFPDNVNYGDIVRGLPISADSCRAVYCSHVLEHLSLYEFRIALKNTYKVLMKRGTFRLVLPDLEYLIEEYIHNSSPEAAIKFMQNTSLGKEVRNRKLKPFIHEWLGNAQHLWMWDYRSLEDELKKAGFNNIRRAQFGDSSNPAFQDVEDKDRWDNCLGVECKK